jgi:hypothetical protein
MKYENFIEFFSSLDADNNELNSRWEELSKKKRKANLITIIIILVIDAFVLYKIKFFSIFAIVPIFIVDIFIFIISLIFSGTKDVSKFNKDYKDKVINKMLENFIEELDYIPLKSLPSNIYDEAKYGGHYNRYYSDDYFEGKINDQKIVMADLLVQEETKKRDKDGNEESETTTIFNGLFGKINLNKSINSNLTITKDYGFSFFNKQKLEMDSYEFEKAFNVYTDNNIIGMQLLTSDIQEDILALYNKYKISFHISIMHNKMYVLFNTGSMFEVFSTPNSPNEVLEKYFDIMKFIYKLVDKILKTIDSTQI